MGEHLMIVHRERFARQAAPDGTPWQALSPRYLRRKKKNKGKMLQLEGYLANTLRYQISPNELLFGSNRPYAAIHQFGGEIQIAARSQRAYFRQGKNGTVGNQFTQKKKSNFTQWVTLGAYTIRIPARPFLGTSDADNDALVAIALRHIDRALSSATS
jgi:phage gpG-like protein